MDVLLKHCYSNIHFYPIFVGFTYLGGNPAFLESGVVYTDNKPEKVELGGVVNVLTQVFVNQHSCLAES
jgi:hypothetical protein